MAIFKTKIKKEKPQTEKKPEKITEKVSVKKEPTAWNFLKAPYVSEKATALAKENKYIFVVSDKANKNQIKNATEELYKVKVLNVNIIRIPRKKKRLGKFRGWKKGFKKAVIEIAKGQKIDIYPS